MDEPEKTGAERRVYPRYPILMHGFADPIGVHGAGRLQVVVSNVSQTGMLVHIDRGEMVHVNDLLRFSFHLLPAGKIVWLTGRIKWIAQGLVQHIGNWSVGILFFETPEEDINRIFVPARDASLHNIDPGVLPPSPEPVRRKPIPGLPGV